MREASQSARGAAPYGQLEMEAVIRAALGESEVDTSGIGRPKTFEIQIAAIGYIAIRLGLSEPEFGQLIIDAENLALERGFKPPLAD